MSGRLYFNADHYHFDSSHTEQGETIKFETPNDQPIEIKSHLVSNSVQLVPKASAPTQHAGHNVLYTDAADNLKMTKTDGSTITVAGVNPSFGLYYKFNTTGITQYNRGNANLGIDGKFYDTLTGGVRYDGIFYGAPISSYAWNTEIFPSTIPSNHLITNLSVVPGTIQHGFQVYNSSGKTPIRITMKGSLFISGTIPDGALCNNITHYFHGANPTYTSGFTVRVGIVRRHYNASVPAIVSNDECYEDYNVPFRMSYNNGDILHFSSTFQIEGENNDPATGLAQEYMPYINHNATIFPSSSANIRWREVSITFETGKDF